MKKLYFILIGFLVFGAVDAQNINIPDANFKAKLLAASSTNHVASTETPSFNGIVSSYNTIDTNYDGKISVSEALAIKYLDVSNTYIADLTGIESFTNLIALKCNTNQLTSINVSGLNNLQYLDCSSNQLPSLNLSGLTNLQLLNCGGNQLPSLNVSGLTNLQLLNCSDNQLSNLDLSGLTNLQVLYCGLNQLPSLNVSGLTNLQYLECSDNQLQSIDLSGLTNLQELDCSDNWLQSLNVSGLTNLQELVCSYNQLPSLNLSGLTNLWALYCINNQLPSLDVSGLTNLLYLWCGNNQLPSLDVSGLTNLKELSCSNIQLQSLNVSGLTNLNYLDCSNNQLQSLNVSGLTNLLYLWCGNNQLPSLDVSGLTLYDLYCSNNQLPSLDVSGLTNLHDLDCSNNQLTSLDVSNQSILSYLVCNNNQLTTLFMKNGSNESNIDFSSNPNLQYICADEVQIGDIQNHITQYGYTNCHVNSYCSFVPGGTFYTIQGNNRYDSDNNGCSPMDINYPNLKLSFTDGTNSGNLIPDTSGAYRFDVQEGTQTLTPILEYPNYFVVSPPTATVYFPTTASPYTQNFCITANGTHNDLEVSLFPTTSARPGFDAHYVLVYKNNGTNTQSGTVNLTFNDGVLDYVLATPSVSTQAINNLTWNFSNLAPFETRTIDVTFNLNSPIEVPPLNSGDVLHYTATVNGLTDETPNDNTSVLNQNVINGLDPNYKTCSEGTTVLPSTVGQYVHYMIGFENTGTADAQNIVVKDMIDTTKYDVTTLVPITGSAPFTTRITNTNQVEFIFQNINLPFAAGSNDGYVAFKIKTKPSLVLGDTFSNTANIFFDYNFPIVTNTATTAVSNVLSNQDFEFANYFAISPNPANEVLNINFKQSIEVHSMNIYNVLGQLVQVVPNAKDLKTIDVSGLKTGTYFIKIITDKGASSSTFIKE